MNTVEVTIKVNGVLAGKAVISIDHETVNRIDKVRSEIMSDIGSMNFARIQNLLETE